MIDLASQSGAPQGTILSRASSTSEAVHPKRAACKTRTEGIAPHENLSILTIKHLIIEGYEGAKHINFVRQCFKLSDVRTYSIKYNIYPKSQERADIVFVSGNLAASVISFLQTNDRLVRSTPKIALGDDFSLSDQVALLNAGFDDAFNLRAYNPGDAAWKILSIRDRHQKTLYAQQLEKNRDQKLSDFCNPGSLSFTQKKLLNSLIEAPGRFCSYRKLAVVVSRYGDYVSNVHIRVLIWQIRSQLYKSHTIVNVQGEGYRLLDVGNGEPEKPPRSGA